MNFEESPTFLSENLQVGNGKIGKHVVVAHQYDLWLDDEVGDPSQYRDEFEVFLYAQAEDKVYLHIDTVGGNLDTAVRFANAVQDCSANVTGILEHKAFSAGSLILLSCPSIAVMPNSGMMIHSPQGGSYGSLRQQGDCFDFQTQQINAILKQVYAGFLSEKELTAVLDDSRELWFTAEEVIARLPRLIKHKQKEAGKDAD